VLCRQYCKCRHRSLLQDRQTRTVSATLLFFFRCSLVPFKRKRNITWCSFSSTCVCVQSTSTHDAFAHPEKKNVAALSLTQPKETEKCPHSTAKHTGCWDSSHAQGVDPGSHMLKLEIIRGEKRTNLRQAVDVIMLFFASVAAALKQIMAYARTFQDLYIYIHIYTYIYII
jgi:hypothetical protein